VFFIGGSFRYEPRESSRGRLDRHFNFNRERDYATPGHTPGSTTWTWRSCDGTHCLDIVYADSLNPISDEGFRFKGDATHASLAPAFQRSIETVDRLPCDLMISVHPGFTGLDEKLAARTKGVTPDPFIDTNACHAYAADASQKLAKRIAGEQ
jgi:metallo-beta-lactamase class B